MTERRRSERKPYLTEVNWEGQGGHGNSRLCDIGLNGVFIDTMNPMPVGANLKFCFNLKGCHLVATEGIVVQSQPAIGMGVQFTNLKPEDEELIREMIGVKSPIHDRGFV